MPQPGRRPAINPDDVLEKLEETGALFHSTGEIADMMDASKPTVLDRLRTLEEQGRVRSRKVAGNTPIWYLPEVENRRLDEYSNGGGGEETDDTPDGGDTEEPSGGPDDPDLRADGGQTSVERARHRAAQLASLFGGIAVAGFASTPPEPWAGGAAWAGAVLITSALLLRESGVDRRMGEWLDARLRRIDEEGGAVAFLWHVAQEESLGPVNPETPVERVARLDIVGGLIFVGSAVCILLLGVWVELGGAASVINVLTPPGALAALLLSFVGIGVAVVLLYLSLLASFAIGGVRDRNDHPEPVADVD